MILSKKKVKRVQEKVHKKSKENYYTHRRVIKKGKTVNRTVYSNTLKIINPNPLIKLVKKSNIQRFTFINLLFIIFY